MESRERREQITGLEETAGGGSGLEKKYLLERRYSVP
jgi:hypothetical protein